MKGRVTNSRAMTTPARVKATSIPTGLFGPYSASRVIPATTVGRAKGRSITELTMRLPGKLSLTRTQAIAVPVTTLTATTITAAMSVSFRAAIACGEVTADQNATEAAIGRLSDERGDRDQHDQAQIRGHEAAPEGGAPEAR